MPDDKGTILNQRVWALFEKAGFYTVPNSNEPAIEASIELSKGKKRKVDLLAEVPELGVKIIGENKARKELDGSFTAYVHDYKELKKVSGAKAVLFVSNEKDLNQDDKNYALNEGFIVWESEELDYYEALVDTLGAVAKYEILHSMGIETNEEAFIYHVLAIHFKQPFSNSDTDLFLFTANPEMLLRTCVVLRKAAGSKNAYQRILKKDRLSKIARFITQDDDSLLPPNIIVHFNEDVNWDSIDTPIQDSTGRKITLTKKDDSELVVLQIPMKYASMEIIDGQHRLFGFVNTNPATKKFFNLVVLGLANVSQKKRTETFVAINDNARRMDPNLVAYLKLTEDEEDCQKDNELMAINVVYKLNQTTPFKKKIRFLDRGNQKITLKGFAGYDLKGLLGERGLLRKYYSHNSDAYADALRLYFSMLKSLFPNEWNNPEKYIIFTNRGISAFLKLMKSSSYSAGNRF